MNPPLFSVIVPCCDVAAYVGDTIASLKAQAAPFEALFVIEESHDETERVVRAAVGDDARFHLFTEPRSGSPATPRNTGLAAACGDYVVFLDGDDTLAPTALEDLAAVIARFPNTDLFPAAVREDERLYDNYPATLANVPLTGAEATCLVSSRYAEPPAMAPLTVYRRAFLVSRDLKFVDGLRHEDEEFTPRALYLAETVVPTHLAYYLYRRRAASITTQSRERRLEDIAKVYRSLFAFHERVRPPAAVSRAWARNWLNTLFSAFFFTGGATVISPARRRAALEALFAGGFGDFNALVRFASRPKRLGAAFLRFAVRTRFYAPAQLFFDRVYYVLAARRGFRAPAG